MNGIEPLTMTSKAATRAQILKRLQDVRELPTLPAVFMHVMRTLHNPNATVRQIAHVIESDPAIAMKVLKLINSSFYGLSRSVDSIQQAIVLLGASTLESIVISASVIKALEDPVQDQIFDREAFWQHSIACGMIARCLNDHVSCCAREDGFIAGVIHDVGKLVLDQYFHEHLREVAIKVQAQEQPWLQAEREVIGTDHAEIGALLAESWCLPQKLIEIIAQHHSFHPELKHASLVALIQIADMLARKYQIGSGGGDQVPEVQPLVWQHLKISQEIVDSWANDILAEIAKGNELLEIVCK